MYGNVRIRKKGSAGTHNGVKSVVQCLASTDFARIRVGIGVPKVDVSLMEHVIGAIDEADIPLLREGIEKATLAVGEILKNGVDIAMNKYN